MFETIETNSKPRWRVIKSVDDKQIIKYFEELKQVSKYLNEPIGNVRTHVAGEDKKYKCKNGYKRTKERWKNVQVKKMKFKKIVSYILVE